MSDLFPQTHPRVVAYDNNLIAGGVLYDLAREHGLTWPIDRAMYTELVVTDDTSVVARGTVDSYVLTVETSDRGTVLRFVLPVTTEGHRDLTRLAAWYLGVTAAA
jgi:hypothetical protein